MLSPRRLDIIDIFLSNSVWIFVLVTSFAHQLLSPSASPNSFAQQLRPSASSPNSFAFSPDSSVPFQSNHKTNQIPILQIVILLFNYCCRRGWLTNPIFPPIPVHRRQTCGFIKRSWVGYALYIDKTVHWQNAITNSTAPKRTVKASVRLSFGHRYFWEAASAVGNNGVHFSFTGETIRPTLVSPFTIGLSSLLYNKNIPVLWIDII